MLLAERGGDGDRPRRASDGAGSVLKGVPDRATAMMVDVTLFGKRSGLTGDTLDVHRRMLAVRVHAPAAGGGHLDDVRHVLRELDGGGRERFARVAASRLWRPPPQLGRASVGPSSGMITSTFGSASSTRVASATSGGPAAALPGFKVVEERQAAALWKRSAHLRR